MLIVVILIFSLIGWGIAEYRNHNRNILKIPIRIHVNGSRGKSSVTRLIGSALREAGLITFTKTTGTSARIIFPDGTEQSVIRAGKPNIIEQLSIIRKALTYNPEVLVVECMAVQPVLQEIVEERMIRSNYGVITNVRPDHVDEMGPTMQDIEFSLSGTIPRNGTLITAEADHIDYMKKRAAELNTEFVQVSGDSIRDEDMEGFKYIEHKDNVALALELCRRLGIDRETAVRGMRATEPDPGALRIYGLDFFGKNIKFVNAFAANDAQSYRIIWEMLDIRPSPDKNVVVIVNNRGDRIQRAQQLGELIAGDLPADHFVIAGQYTHALVQRALSSGLESNKITEVGNESLEEIFEKTISLIDKNGIIIGIGNIVGFGNEIALMFINRGKQIVSRGISN
jgi:poly-gamma-glutamate synthase PgsB/CapB